MSEETLEKQLAIAQARLDWLLQFFEVEDYGTDTRGLEPVVIKCLVETRLLNTGFLKTVKQETTSFDDNGNPIEPGDGWEQRCILAGIDHAIKMERIKNDN